MTPRSFFRSFSSKRVLYFVSAAVALATWTGCEVDTSPIGDSASSSVTASATTSVTTSVSSSSGGSVVVVGETGGAPSASSASVSSTPPSPVANDAVGRSCSADADCAKGLLCLNPVDDVIGGGVAGGYCSAPCKGDDDCADDARCDHLGAVSVCMKTCHVGPSANDKCFGRSDVACTRISPESTRGFCLPRCGSDVECETGFTCGPNGLCMHDAEPTESLGEACDQGDGKCWGSCEPLSFVAGDGMCSATCVFGREPELQCGGVESGYCGLPAVAGAVVSLAPGDAASCAPSCDKSSDCIGELLCVGHAGVNGHGYCVAPTSCEADVNACAKLLPDFPNVECAATAYGHECIDPKYALLP